MSALLPKAYKVGLQDFYGRDFLVTPSVLIPRPETEQIIDAVLNLVGKPYLPGVKASTAKIDPKGLKILDVGTGSGCVAITLQLEIPEANLSAIDISRPAIKIAQKNAIKYGVSINFIISNLLKNVKFTPDIIVANLPYVDRDWSWLDLKSLAAEPPSALFANNHGLELIFKLIEQAFEHKVKYLFLESDPCQHARIIDFALQNNYHHIETRGFVIGFYNPQA